jgi:HK97 family phage prohead protease
MSRFNELAARLAAKGAHDPGALAAYIGRKKYGRAGMAALAAKGRGVHHAEKNLMKDGEKRSEFLGVRAFDFRSYTIEDCTVRDDGDGRTVEAYAAAFNIPAEIRDQDGHYNEVISPGSFDKTIAENGTRVGVFYNHARSIYGTPDGALSVPIGVPVEAPRPDNHGVMTVTRYLNNPLADSVLDAIKQRAITAQSFSGRFIKSTRTRATDRGALPTIARSEVALREYGPTPFPAYQQAHVVGTRSTEMWMSDLLRMDPQERAELFREMVALATPLETPRAEPVREVIVVTPSIAVRTDEAVEEPPAPATPDVEPARSDNEATSDPDAGADEPHTHSIRQADIKRRIRVAMLMEGVR